MDDTLRTAIERHMKAARERIAYHAHPKKRYLTLGHRWKIDDEFFQAEVELQELLRKAVQDIPLCTCFKCQRQFPISKIICPHCRFEQVC